MRNFRNSILRARASIRSSLYDFRTLSGLNTSFERVTEPKFVSIFNLRCQCHYFLPFRSRHLLGVKEGVGAWAAELVRAARRAGRSPARRAALTQRRQP